MYQKKSKVVLYVVIILALLLTVAGMLCLDKIFTPNVDKELSATEIEKDMRTVTIDSERYLMKDNINILFIVVDEFGKVDETALEASYLSILSFNSENESFSLFSIDACTLVDINESLKESRISKAFTLGNGYYESCYEMVDTVEKYIYGLKLDQFVCINSDCVKQIVEYIDSIFITLDDDYTEIDEEWTKNSLIELNDDNVYSYINGKTTEVRHSFERQNKVFNAIINKVDKNSSYNIEFLYGINDKIENDIVTNANTYTLRKIIRVFHNYTNNGMSYPTGNLNIVNNEMTFEVNIDDLKRIVKELFYEKRND